ncbi:MAG: glycogen synthase GlgA [Acidobacteriaceae bacterium]|nr:glycogen synthase GlgA [Acidobacteriaceae bacterium]MBV9779987.1 glycogen synthase GlgA [Acidobacteriaceae bacterium]
MAKILMVSSEAAPFAKTGGLADVLGALPKALVEAGEEAAVVLPLYRHAAVLNPRPVYDRLQFAVGSRGFSANILEQVQGGVRYFFVRIPELYDRDAFYDEGGREYPDNHLRFAALCHAALGVARYLFNPDIIHGHDWQAGLLPVLLRDTFRYHPAYLGMKTVFTIHNLGYQGLFTARALADLGLPARLFRPDLLEFYGQISLLKGGLVYSDMLTTVSPRYAQEIQTPAFGFGMDGLLRARSSSLVGILNGADYGAWDPATDRNIPKNYDRTHLDGKRECKRALLAEAGLPSDRLERPLMGMVSRFAEQKGFDLLMHIPHELAAEDLSLVVLGSGDRRLEDFFRRFASAYPDRVAAKIGYDEGLAHRIEAGSDMFLMPSRYEPCGLNQMYSMRYGTLPVVHATGGLDDTVDADTGFKFRADDSHDLLACVRDALQVYGTPRWTEMMNAAMQRDFSWPVSAAEYIRLYRRL